MIVVLPAPVPVTKPVFETVATPVFAELYVIEPLYVSKSIQNAGIEFSESGVKAAAFTFHGMSKGAAAPQESVNFVLDHPFIYQIYDVNGCVLFMGVVNNPNK